MFSILFIGSAILCCVFSKQIIPQVDAIEEKIKEKINNNK